MITQSCIQPSSILAIDPADINFAYVWFYDGKITFDLIKVKGDYEKIISSLILRTKPTLVLVEKQLGKSSVKAIANKNLKYQYFIKGCCSVLQIPCLLRKTNSPGDHYPDRKKYSVNFVKENFPILYQQIIQEYTKLDDICDAFKIYHDYIMEMSEKNKR